MSTYTEKVYVWRVQADRESSNTEVEYTRFIKREAFVDGESVGVTDLPSDTKIKTLDDLWVV